MADPRMSKCAALACAKMIGRKKLVCIGHWEIVPGDLRRALIEHYTVGQDETGKISPEYRIAVANVVKFLAFREGVLVKEESSDTDRRAVDPDQHDDLRGGQDEYENPE